MVQPEKKLILLVDDAPENLDVLSGILREEFKIKVALNGERALKIARSAQRPDLILLDVMMPDMDGFDVCRTLKADDNTREIPIIFVTAKTGTGDEKEGFAIGAADYIAKPINPEIVKVRVKTQLDLADAQQEAKRLLEENLEMLDQTLVGSMYVVSNLLSWANPAAYFRASRLRAFMEGMVAELEIVKDRWQLHLAATMSQIGLVALSAEEMNRYSTGQGVSIKFLNLFKNQAEIGGRALAQVPRLETVSAIIENQLTPLPKKGEYPETVTERDTYTIGLQLLRLIIDFDHKLLGDKSSVALDKLEKDTQHDPILVAALKSVVGKMEWISCALSQKKLTPGMLLDEDIIFPDEKGEMARETLLGQPDLDKISAMFNDNYRLYRVKVPFKVDKDGNLPSVKAMQEMVIEPEGSSANQESEEESKGQVDLAVVEPIMVELVALLQDDDPESKNLASRLFSEVSGTDMEDMVNQMQQMVSQYEFPEALELAEKMAETMDIKLG
ncbi:MAG: response regulator [Magnetococcales bacterium]|nr:response regulator [Magnetococcales bacterium]